MTLQVCVLGIDGSGKSTITASLAAIVSAESGLICGSAGDRFQILGPEKDFLTEKFYPEGLPLSGHLSRWFKKAAKRATNSRKLYPLLKLIQMILQDRATYLLSKRYKADVIFSDGNLVLSGVGRAGNYLRPASDSATRVAPNAEDLAAVFSCIFEGVPLPAERQKRLPRLGIARFIYRLTTWLGLRIVWLPDVVFFLDLSPRQAMQRIASRKQKIDRHENEADLAQAREMYHKALAALSHYRSSAVHFLAVDTLAPGDILHAIVQRVRTPLEAKTKPSQQIPLGTTATKLTGQGFFAKVLNYRYLVRYLLAKFFRSAWREPLFILSSPGKLFLKEGYSAGVMRAIYDRDTASYGLFDRIFLEYPLHRAVYDRLHILTNRVESLLQKRLDLHDSLTIFTAPSGFAYDLFGPLEAIAKKDGESVRRVTIVAADLDPYGVLEKELSDRAARIGVRFFFRRGDLTVPEMRAQFEEWAPFDLVLFVGLSAWLPKLPLLRHLEWIRNKIRPDGLLISDSFTAEAYAYSGKYIGYKASYYAPEVYRSVVDY